MNLGQMLVKELDRKIVIIKQKLKRQHTKAHKAKIAASLMNHPVSQETRDKLAEVQRKRWAKRSITT